METWAEYVRREREARGWSMRELDRRAGLGIGTTSSWETGGRKARPYLRVLVRRAFGADIPETLGMWMMRRRRELGLSQLELADRLGYYANTVYRWESDTCVPRPEAMQDIETILGECPHY